MHTHWTGRSRLLIVGTALLCADSTWAQKGAPSSGGTGGNTGTAGFPSTSGTMGTGSLSRPGAPGIGGMPGRVIFLSGKVVFSDGSPANPNIRIERVCGGVPRLESHTDSKGRFSFQVGQEQAVDVDASDPSGGMRTGQPVTASNSTPGGLSTNNSMDPLWNCELRAAYPGYRSDVVELGTRRTLDDPDLGTIVLHRLANVQGSTISVTTALAPKHAQKDYEKGLQFAQKGDFENAETRLKAATDLYPKYAIAWYALGQVQQRQGKTDDAVKAWQSAVTSDNHYVSPLDALASVSLQQSKWQDAADYSKQATDLNPVEFPNSFWCNAFANYQLKKLDAAERSAKELLKLDTAHKFPQADDLLAHILVEKGDFSEAAVHLRAYLALQPNAKDAAALRQVLEKIDQANAEPK